MSNNSSFETKYLVADFAEMHTIAEYKEKIADKLSDIDVALVVVNAGVIIPGDLKDISEKDTEDAIRCLNLQYFYLSKVLLTHLTKRKERKNRKSAMVFVNSYWSS